MKSVAVHAHADDAIQTLRARQQRNFLATLLLSQGVPMLRAGDEIGRTQGGYNNGYCQDRDVSWFDWQRADPGLLEFTQRVIRLRNDHPVFRRRRWFQGRPTRGSGVSDIVWFKQDGGEMTEEDWSNAFARSLGVFLNGDGLAAPDRHRVVDDSFCVRLNAHYEPLSFSLPQRDSGRRWAEVLDTGKAAPPAPEPSYEATQQVAVAARALVILRRIA